MAADDKVVIGLTHAADDAESVLISYLLGVEALRAGKEALMWLTKDGVNVATDGFAATVDVPGAPSIAGLHAEYIEQRRPSSPARSASRYARWKTRRGPRTLRSRARPPCTSSRPAVR